MRQIKYKQYNRSNKEGMSSYDNNFIRDGYLLQFVNLENVLFGLIEKPDGTLELVEHCLIKFTEPWKGIAD